MKVKLKEQGITVLAPRPLVFETLSSFALNDGAINDGPQQEGQENARLIERDGNRLVMEFHSRDGRKTYQTLEEVILYPHERVTFRHLEGPLHRSQEQFDFADVRGGTRTTHNGEIECRMRGLPGAGWLVARFYVKRHYQRLVLRHMNDLKNRVEAAATRAV